MKNKTILKRSAILFVFIVSLLLATHTTTTALTLSKEAEISILTCSPGGELYSLFGHTAIRINDPQENVDVVFNYGTFDFATKGFYLKYAQGLLPYQLTYTSYQSFLHNYEIEKRTVYSQTLQMDSTDKQKLVDLILVNYEPENRSYLYNFLFDNCTTRSRDIVEKSLQDTIEWKLTDTGKSFWNLLDEYLSASPWVKWGIHSILGQPGTQTATTYQYMFLPDYLMYGLDSAIYKGYKLIDKTKIVYQAPKLEINNPWYKSPYFIFPVGALLLIALLQMCKNAKVLAAVSIPLFLFTAILGILIVFLGGFTEHPITAPNWNILWANPLNLIVLFFIGKKQTPEFIRGYLMFYMITLSIAIPVWIFAQPAVPMPSIFLIILMLYLCFRLKNKSMKKNKTDYCNFK